MEIIERELGASNVLLDRPLAPIAATSSRVLGAFSSAIIVGTIIMAIVPGWLAPYPPETADSRSILLPPSLGHWFGTDINGMDILSRVIWGARIDLSIALSSTCVGLLFGTLVGVWVGFYFGRQGWQGWVSDLVMRFADTVQAFPVFVLALALVAVLGRNIFDVIYVLIFLQVPFFLRITRGAVLRTREEGFVDAARLVGNSELRLLIFHVLPNSLTPTLVNASVVAGGALLLTAGLSFVGAGVPAPTPEWGYMVSVGARNLYTGEWWPALFPGIYIGLVVISLAAAGDLLRRIIDPLQR